MMALSSYQQAFASAVNSGQREVWQQILQDKESNPGIALNLDLCLLDSVTCPIAVADVLRYRPSLSAENSEGERAIHLAARSGPPESVTLLARAGSTVNCSSRAGWGPLHVACLHNQLTNVEALLKLGANKNATRTAERLTPLHVAVAQGHKNIVKLLLLSGADPNVRMGAGRDGFTAFALTVAEGDLSMLDVMLEMSSQMEYTGDVHDNYPLHLAVTSGDIEKCRRILASMGHMIPPGVGSRLQRGLSQPHLGKQGTFATLLNLANSQERTALHLAIEQGRLDLIQLLLEAGADVQLPCQGKLPLELAISHAQTLLKDQGSGAEARMLEEVKLDDTVPRMLVEQSVNLEVVSARGQYPVHLAVEGGLFDLALVIMEKTPHLVHHLDSTGCSALHLACKQKSRQPGRMQCITRLLEMGLSASGGADPLEQFSPLHHAVANNDLELVSLLIKWGADVNAVSGSESPCAPLHTAVTTRNFTVLETLLGAGADVEVKDSEGKTALYQAVMWKMKDMAEHLLNNNASPNVLAGRFQQSPLHSVSTNFPASPVVNLELMELLIRNKGDLEQVDSRGLTPLHLLLTSLVCWTMMPAGAQLPTHLRLSALRLMVEAGCQLTPWVPQAEGMYRRTVLQTMAYCGLLPEVYYLANVGWPLNTEMSSGWLHLPGSTPPQDIAHAYLLLRQANPFPLLHLCRAVVRNLLQQHVAAAERRTEIATSIEKLPLPQAVKMFLCFRDKDYSDAEDSWLRFAHLLPAGALDIGLSSDGTLISDDEM